MFKKLLFITAFLSVTSGHATNSPCKAGISYALGMTFPTAMAKSTVVICDKIAQSNEGNALGYIASHPITPILVMSTLSAAVGYTASRSPKLDQGAFVCGTLSSICFTAIQRSQEIRQLEYTEHIEKLNARIKELENELARG